MQADDLVADNLAAENLVDNLAVEAMEQEEDPMKATTTKHGDRTTITMEMPILPTSLQPESKSKSKPLQMTTKLDAYGKRNGECNNGYTSTRA
eukprot:jgi/Psemu1/55200/gm1.55200_g